MSNDKPETVIFNEQNDLRGPTLVKETDKTKQASVTNNVKSNETEIASLKKKISDISSNIVACHQNQKVHDIWKLPGIGDLCETLKQLLGQSKICFDDATLATTAPDLSTLLEIIKISCSYSCCLNESCNILESLLHIFQPEHSTQRQTQLQILKELSYLYHETTNFPKAIDCAQKVLNLSEEIDQQNFKADADYILAVSYARQNLFEKARSHLHEYEKYCRGTADELGEAKISFAWSIIALGSQEDERVLLLQHANDFLEKAKAANDEILELKALHNLGYAHLRLFNVQESIKLSEELLELAKKNCHVNMEMKSKRLKATAYQVLGENEKAYRMFKECLAFFQNGNDDKYLETIVLNNISFVTLHLSQKYAEKETLKEEALKFIQRCLSISKSINIPEPVGLAHFNTGLVYMEIYDDYDNASKHFHEGLNIAEQLKSARLIHQGCCCMGRLHQAKGETDIAMDYYTKALEKADLPCTHWGDAENLRFSPDYQLALQHIDRKNLKDAATYLEKVIQRCKRQGRSVKDSLLKICFNDMLKKPYQYLQYVYLEMEVRKDALVIGEEGRARDFYDKLVDRNTNVVESLANPEELLQIPNAYNTAVLFLSQLTVVNRVYCWFIGSDGKIVDVFWVSQDDWIPLNDKLCLNMCELANHWRKSEISVEYRGVKILEDDGIFSSSSGFSQSVSEHAGFGRRDESSISSKTPTRSQGCSRNAMEEMSEITNKISELFLKPIEHHLEQMVERSTTRKPSLLIIPQEHTFNIPYAALRLENGKHLCNEVTLLEAYSFHSFIHSNRQTEPTSESCGRMEKSLIVGNPTNDLPCAQQEAEMIAQLLGVTPLIGRLATRSEVISHLSSAPIIHFACHGSYDGQRLFLAHEKEGGTNETKEASCLTVDDVSQLNVNAGMVVLSACHTARGKISIEGVFGLARAFLMAGAKSVVTALWAIPDHATMKFMEKFYKNLREMRVGDALSATMCQMQEDELFKHVVKWGSFKILGANVKVSLPE